MNITVLLALFFSNINCILDYEYGNHVAPIFQDEILMALIVDGQNPQHYQSEEDSSTTKLTKYEKKQEADSRVRLIKKKNFKL